MIPKRVFYVWGYGEKKSNLANICIENWRMMLPDYEIIEVNEKTKEWFDFDYEYENNLWFKTVYDLKMWAYVSDYIRVKTIYEHGGIYADTDITIYKNLDDLLKNNMFIGNQKNNIPDLAFFGAKKNNPILKDMLEFYKDKIWKDPNYIIINIFKKIIFEKYDITYDNSKIHKFNDLTIYPYEYFFPYFYTEIFSHNMITTNTYTMHWCNASWMNKKNIFFLSNKHRIPLKTLLKQLAFIEKVDTNANKKTQVLNVENENETSK